MENMVSVKETTNVVEFKNIKKNDTICPSFIRIAKMSQYELKQWLFRLLIDHGYDAVSGDGYLYAKGDLPILLTAHMDTVHKQRIEDYYEEVLANGDHKLWSPQGIGGDDRCGVWMIFDLIDLGYRPSILFCEDEEIGCVGSSKFVKSPFINDLMDLKYLVQLDRRNANDAVYYRCDNIEFEKYITNVTGYEKAWGTCSDISNLAPASKVAAVNLSCGYYNEHHLDEYVILEEMFFTRDTVQLLIDDLDNADPYEFIEKKWSSYGGYYGNYGSWRNYSGWDDDDDDWYYGRYRTYYGNYGTEKNTATKDDTKNYSSWERYDDDDYVYKDTENRRDETYRDASMDYDDGYLTRLIVDYKDKNGETVSDYCEGYDENDALVQFFMNNDTVCYKDVVSWYYTD